MQQTLNRTDSLITRTKRSAQKAIAWGVCWCVMLAPPRVWAVDPVTPDTLTTTDQRSMSGKITFAGGHVRMKETGGKEISLKPTEIAELRITPVKPVHPMTGPAGGAPAGGAGSEQSDALRGLKAEYFSDAGFTRLRAVRIEPTIEFNARTDTPSTGLTHDIFVRWSGLFVPETNGTFTFSVSSSNVKTVRVLIDNNTTADAAWPARMPDNSAQTINLRAGEPVRLLVQAEEVRESGDILLRFGRNEHMTRLVPERLLRPPVGFTRQAFNAWQVSGAAQTGLRTECFEAGQFEKPFHVSVTGLPLVGHRALPSGSIKPPKSVRWTGMWESPTDETFILSVSKVTPQKARVWFNGKKVLDTFIDGDQKIDQTEVSSKAGEPVELRIETTIEREVHDTRSLILYRPTGSSKEVNLPRDRLYLPTDAPRPVIVGMTPVPVARNRPDTDDMMDVDVVLVEPVPTGPVRVELRNERGDVLGTDGVAPYRFRINTDALPDVATKDPAASREARREQRRRGWDGSRLGLVAYATDAAGKPGVSKSFRPPQENVVPAPLGEGWLVAGIGTRVNASMFRGLTSTDPIRLVGAQGGDLLKTSDSLQFLYQPLHRDGELSADLQPLGTSTDHADKTRKPGGTLLVRDDLHPRARYIGLTVDEVGLTLIRRNVFGALPSFMPLQDVTLPVHAKFVRSNNRVFLMTSQDGTTWTETGRESLSVDDTVYAGVCNLGRVDRVMMLGRLGISETGTDQLLPIGVQFTSGAVLAGDVVSVTDTQIGLNRAGKKLTFERSNVARLFLARLPRARLNSIESQTGVLLSEGDVFEGEVSDINATGASVDSILFGPRRFTPDQASVVLMQPVTGRAGIGQFEVALTDGSTLYVDDLKVDLASVSFRSTDAGEMTVDGLMISYLRRGAIDASARVP